MWDNLTCQQILIALTVKHETEPKSALKCEPCLWYRVLIVMRMNRQKVYERKMNEQKEDETWMTYMVYDYHNQQDQGVFDVA